MRSLSYLLLIIACVFLGSVLLTGIDYFMNLDDIAPSEQDQLIHGRIEPWSWSEAAWSGYPALVPIEEAKILWERRAFLMTAPVWLLIYFAIRLRKKYSLMSVALGCLLAGAIPYYSGRLALLYNTAPENAGPWIATMLLGVLYCVGACLAFALLGLLVGKRSAEKQYSAAGLEECHTATTGY